MKKKKNEKHELACINVSLRILLYVLDNIRTSKEIVNVFI